MKEDNVFKPVLYHGFSLGDKGEIDYRISRESNAEIYKLTNGKYLYLIFELPASNFESRNETIKIEANGRVFCGVVSEVYSRHKLERLLNSFATPLGLDAVAGMNELKSVLMEDVVKPFRNPEKYKAFKIGVPNGILLYGPPGCGKTFIVEKLAEELGYNYVALKHSDVASSYVHGSVQMIKDAFDEARKSAPTVLFIDEIDGLAPNREMLSGNTSTHKQEEINEFLMQLNNAAKDKVLVIAATNKPQLLDPALVRPGRMDYHIYVGPPDYQARLELFKLYLEGRPQGDINLEHFAVMTNNYASVDIRLICDKAARIALSSDHDVIEQGDMEEALRITPSSIIKS